MKSLKVAVVTRPGSVLGKRNAGWWAYKVPEFEFQHFQVEKRATVSRVKFDRFDLIVWEDGKSSLTWIDHGPPIAYVVGDSTLSEEHYRQRLRLGRQADLLLVDWDCLERFRILDRPTKRFSYAVNDARFHPWDVGKDVDVSYHVNEDTSERRELGNWLEAMCKHEGYTFARGTRTGDDYARAFARSRVTVNINRTPTTRNHRVFDAMACRTCVLTDPLPEVSGEIREPGWHYLVYQDREDLAMLINWSLQGDRWERVADAAMRLVIRHHRWAVRAGELRRTIGEVFPWLN